jgi:glycine/D-amino acid oxidase-like deaminating enzyme
MQVDYIVVGLGLAGMAFSEELRRNNKSFVVFEDKSQNSSLVAGGMYNPVILKRFTPVWNGAEQIQLALPFYEEIEKLLNNKYHYNLSIYRVFKSIEEQNNWFVACDKPLLKDYMIPKVKQERIKGINSEFGFGELTNTGRIETKLLLEDYQGFLNKEDLLFKEKFEYSQLNIEKECFKYNGITSAKIVFCEGFGLKKNPFFNNLPMQEVKGELLVIHTPELNIDFLIKAAVFVMPLGDNYYKIGATFNWNDKTKNPTPEGKQELIKKLNTVISAPYEIVNHLAGIRPTVKDRRPLAGRHSELQNMAILNGLGTRGVMIAPTLAKQLYNHLENGKGLSQDVSITRFS